MALAVCTFTAERPNNTPLFGDIVSAKKEHVGEREQAVLRQIDRQGHILILEDGRMLRVAPSDATLAVTWMPSTILEICEDPETSSHVPPRCIQSRER